MAVDAIAAIGEFLTSDTVISAAAAGAVGAAAAGAMAPKSPALPQVKPPPTMPTPDSQAVVAAQRRSLAAQVARRGRQSTILTDTGDTLG